MAHYISYCPLPWQQMPLGHWPGQRTRSCGAWAGVCRAGPLLGSLRLWLPQRRPPWRACQMAGLQKAPLSEEGFGVVTLNFMVTKVAGSNAYSFGRALDRRRREGPRHLQMSVASRSSAEARGHFTITLTLMRVVSGLCHCLELRAAAPKALRRDPVCGSAGLEFVLRADEGHSRLISNPPIILRSAQI